MHHFKKFIVCFLFIPMVFTAQESDYVKDIADYLDNNASMKQYEYAYDALLKMLGSSYPKNDRNAQEWEYLDNGKEKALDEIKKKLIPIYMANFTHDEIKHMSAFYASETGLQLINDRSKLTETQKEELNTFYNSTTGQKIITKQEVLVKEIGMASESWSRDLYVTSLSLLQYE